MGKLQFRTIKQQGNARVGELTLNGVTVQTPIFMPVGTKATIKGMILDLLQDEKYIGQHIEPIKVILANTFHLYLRPGSGLIQEAGGLHQFEHWDNGLILTDSGGFQVFSLGLSSKNKAESWQFSSIPGKGGHEVKIKLTEEGVKFSSPFDGTKHLFTPENVVDTQMRFGSDIMMVLDVCSPWDAEKSTIARQMHMTHRWAKRAFDHFKPKYNEARGVLFPIVQGGSYLDLRQESVDFLSEYAWDGIAIWGVSVGEWTEKVREVVSFTAPKLPVDKPRYLMGVGLPEDLRFAIEQGVDMFDCVSATRYGRHGLVFSDEGNIKLSNARYASDFSPLTANCDCYACRNFSKAYFHHLLREKEVLWGVLLGLHNIVYLNRILCDWKKKFLSL